MPTIKDIPGPYRFYFYSFDCNEPMHVHVGRDDTMCKFWLIRFTWRPIMVSPDVS